MSVREIEHAEQRDARAPRGGFPDPGRRTGTEGLAPRDPARAGAGSGGIQLPEGLRGRLEQASGRPLGGVRMHAGGAAAEAAGEMNAAAFAVGQDIHFGAGEYDPGSAHGQHLIAHEVAHTVQQQGGAAAGPQARARAGASAGAGSAALEAEADRFADSVVSGGAPVALSAAGTAVQRKPNQEFLPEVAGSGRATPIGVGEVHREQVKVTNARQAPRHTTFEWEAGRFTETDAVLYQGTKHADRPEAVIEVVGQKPGQEDLGSNLHYQVPGGPAKTKRGPSWTVQVKPPVVTAVDKVRSGKGSKHADPTRLEVGDKVTVSFTFGDIPADKPSTVSTTGDGVNQVVETVGSSQFKGHTYTRIFQAKQLGIADLELAFMWGTMDEDSALRHPLVLIVEMAKRDFLDHTIESTAMLEHARNKAHAWLDSFATAYQVAWIQHTTLLNVHGQSARVGDEPAVMEKKKRQLIDQQLALAAERNEDWAHGANADPDYMMHFDPVAEMAGELTIGADDMRKLEPVDTQQEAKRLEKLLWERWREKNKSALIDGAGKPTPLGQAVDKRLLELK